MTGSPSASRPAAWPTLGLRLCLLSLALVPPLAVAVKFPIDEGKAWTGSVLVLAALATGWWMVWARSSVRAACAPEPTTAASACEGAGVGDSPFDSRFPIPDSRWLLPLLALHAALGLSLLAAMDLPTALERWGEIALWSAIIPLSAAMAAVDRRWLRRLTGAVVLSVSLAAAFSWVAAEGVGPIAQFEGGTFGNRNQLGHFLALGVWPLVAWVLTRRRALPRIVALAVLAIVAQALLLTRSKGSWVAIPGAAVLALGLMLVFRFPIPPQLRCGGPGSLRRWALSLGLIIVLGGGALVGLFAVQHRPQAEAELSTLSWEAQGVTLRRLLWRGTLALALEHPVLGVGVGEWALAYPPHLSPEHLRWEFTRPREAHSDWLQFVAETGLVGLIALAVLLVWAMSAARRSLVCDSRLTTHDSRLTRWSAILALLTLALMALYDFPLQRAVPAILGALWLGALAGIAAPPSLRSSPSPRNSVAGFGGLAIVAVAFLLGVPALGRQLALARDLGSVRAALEGHGGDAAAVVADVEAAWRLGASPLEADRLAAAAMASHAPEVAAAVLRAACERDPLWFDHWRWLAEALIAQGHAEEALAAARRAVALEPEIAQTWRTLGRVAWAARDLTLAEGSLERARALAPGNAEILGELGLFWAAQGREAQAIEVLRESLASDPDNAPLWQTLGLAHWRLGQREGALDALNRAVAADPTLGEAWHLLAVIHLDRHEDAEALDCARRAIALLPESDSVRQTLSQALGRLGAEARNASGEANLGLTGPNPRE